MTLKDILDLTLLIEDNRKLKCTGCGKEFTVNNEFKEAIEYREFNLSGLCKTCQDQIWKKE